MSDPIVSQVRGHALHVMVVDDEVHIQESLHKLMTGWGFAVTIVTSGEEAVELMKNAFLPDIAVVDFRLPGMDGLEVVRRAREYSAVMQAILLTGYASVELVKQALRLDIAAFVTKPYQAEELEKALRRAARQIQALTDNHAIATTSPKESMTLEEAEREYILAALARNNGNRSETARQLKISLRTLFYKIEKYQKQGIEVTKPVY